MRAKRLLGALAWVVVAACATGPESGEVGPAGQVGLFLTLPSGGIVSTVIYEIEGPASPTTSGVFELGAGSTIQATVSLPAGDDYTIELTAFSDSGDPVCDGSADFSIASAESTLVSVTLGCRNVRDVTIEGDFNLCPDVDAPTASAPNAEVGNSISLSAVATDAEGDPLTYAWTGSGGTFSTPTAADTLYTCVNAGTHTLAVVVSDDSFTECSEAALLSVTCDDLPPPPDPATAWSAPVPFDVPLAGDATAPRIAVDANGDATVVWSQGSSSEPQIWASRYDASEQTWGAPVMLQTFSTGAGGGETPQVVVDSLGMVTVVWVQTVTGGKSIYFNRFVPGVGWGNAEPIVPSDVGDTRQPTLAVGGAGIVTAVWALRNGSFDYDLVASRFDGTWGPTVLLEDGLSDISRPKAATDLDGNVTVVWERTDGNFPRVRTTRFADGAWGSIVSLQTLENSAFAPEVDVDSFGNAVAVWIQSDGQRFNVWGRRFAPSVGWGSAQVIDSEDTSGLEPNIAVDPEGNATAVWYQDGANGLANVWANRFVPGVGWGTPAINIERAQAGDATNPAVTVDPQGNATAVWEQSDATRFNMWSNRFDFEGNQWGDFEIIETQNFGDALDPHLVSDPFGRVTAVWRQRDADNEFNINAARFE